MSEQHKDINREDLSASDAAGESPQAAADEMMTTIADLKDQLLRSLADAENIRKRSLREKEDALKYGVTNFARELLTVSDTFERAMSVIQGKNIPDDMKAFVEGIQMTQSQLAATFSKFGIQSIEALHQPFDSAIHQAVFEVEDDKTASGHVAQVVQTGYFIHDRLLRPAMVGVAKKPAETK